MFVGFDILTILYLCILVEVVGRWYLLHIHFERLRACLCELVFNKGSLLVALMYPVWVSRDVVAVGMYNSRGRGRMDGSRVNSIETLLLVEDITPAFWQ